MIGLGLGLTLQRGATGGGGGSEAFVQPIVMAGASNTMGGDNLATTLTAEDDDARLRWFDMNNDAIIDLDYTTGIPRLGDLETQKTSPAINFTKYLADNTPGDVIFVLVATSVGGRGVWAGGDTAESGPWDPDGAGAAWDIGGTPAETAVSGALYKAHTSGNIPSAFAAAVASEFPGRTVRAPIFFGHVANENDTGAPYSVLLDRAERCMTGIRTAWSAPAAPWVIYGGPPEWTYSGAGGTREKITACNAWLAQSMVNVAYVEGQEDNFVSSFPIHNTNAGYRLLGTKLGPAVAVAQERTSAPLEWVDWIDGLSTQPERFYGLYRGLSTYAGPAIELDNGTTTTDIDFLSNGLIDVAAIEAHAGAGDAWITAVYDQMGSGSTMVPEGTNDALIVDAGEICFQGRKIAWGNDTGAILLYDNTFTLTTAGALLGVGREDDGANNVQLAGPQNTLAILGVAGNTSYDAGSGLFNTDPQLDYEPDFILALSGSPGGYQSRASYVDAATGLSVNGEAIGQGASASTFYGTAGTLGWGGRQSATNRYGIGSYTAAAAWSTAPTGADLTAALAFCQAIGSTDDLASA